MKYLWRRGQHVYFRHRGTFARLPDDETSLEFAQAYNEALAQIQRFKRRRKTKPKRELKPSIILRKHKGARAEYVACAWLLREGYEVFRNVSSHGLVDLIAVKDGQTLLIDVKSGLPKSAAIYLTPEQKQRGVIALYVRDDDGCCLCAPNSQ